MRSLLLVFRPSLLTSNTGTFFGSTPETISWYSTIFYRYHDHYITTIPPSVARHPHGLVPSTPPLFHFVGKDQTLINAIIFLYPHRFFTVVAPQYHGLVPSPSLPTTNPAIQRPSYTATRLRTTFRARLFNMLRGPNNSPCGDEWFYFQYWLASPAERRKMAHKVWPARAGKMVRWVERWIRQGGREGCEVVGVVPVEGMLRSLFGVRWVERVRAGG